MSTVGIRLFYIIRLVFFAYITLCAVVGYFTSEIQAVAKGVNVAVEVAIRFDVMRFIFTMHLYRFHRNWELKGQEC